MNLSSIKAEESGRAARLPSSLLQIIRRANRQSKLRAAILMTIAWLPAALLCAVSGARSITSFLTDFAIESRFLIVIPLLVLAEPSLRARLEFVARHFSEEQLIYEEERGRFEAALNKSERMRDSKVARIVIAVLVYLCIVRLIPVVPVSTMLMPWSLADERWHHFSMAGTWSALVGYPILLYLLLLWIWRQLLWTWFLHVVSTLRLRLVASHPDHCAGLAFLRNSLHGQMPFSFAIGAIATGGVANRIIYYGQSPIDFRPVMIAVVIFVVAFCTGPLCIFMRTLLQLRRKGAVAYGALASAVGQEFENKWVRRVEGRTSDILEVPDFSSTTDLYSVVANVNSLRSVPISGHDIAGVAIAALVPAIPLAVAIFPFEVILKGFIKLAL